MMNFVLDEQQRKDCDIEDLARIILHLMKVGIKGHVLSVLSIRGNARDTVPQKQTRLYID